jgi:hypothetical protein
MRAREEDKKGTPQMRAREVKAGTPKDEGQGRLKRHDRSV